MTTGSSFRHIVRFTLPMLLGAVLQQMYSLADTAIVGKHLGDETLAAVGSTGSITYFFYTICLGLATGAGVIIAQHFGADRHSEVKSAIYNSALITIVFGVVISIVSTLLAEPLLIFLETPKNLLPTAVSYMRISCGGTILVALYNWITSVMRSLGDSKTPLIFLFIASVLNVGLDLLFVIVFDWKAEGAAVATIIAQGVAAAGSLIFGFVKNPHIKLSRDDMRFDRAMTKRCIFTGIPIAVQNCVISVSMIALQKVTNSFGDVVMAAYTATMRIENLVQQPFASVSAAVSTFTGQNIGAGKIDRAKQSFKHGIALSTGFSLLVLAVFYIFGAPIVSLFVSSPETVEIGANALRITSSCYIFLGLIHISRGFLNGAGDVGYAMMNGFVEVACRITLPLFITQIASIGFWGIWITTAFTWVATGIFGLIRYKREKWKKKLQPSS